MVSTPKSANITPHGGAAKPRLLDQVREKLRYRHYSLRTERAYMDWIRRFILFHQKRHPAEMGTAPVYLIGDVPHLFLFISAYGFGCRGKQEYRAIAHALGGCVRCDDLDALCLKVVIEGEWDLFDLNNF